MTELNPDWRLNDYTTPHLCPPDIHFNLQVTVNPNELNFSFLCLQVLREVHCIKRKVQCWVGEPTALKQGFDVEEVCVSERIYLGNQCYTLKPLMYSTTSICKHIIMWWNPGTADQSSAGWRPWWCVFVLPRKCNGLRTTDALRAEKKSSQCLTALFSPRFLAARGRH